MDIRLFGVGGRGSAEHLRGARIVLHRVQRLARQHVGLGRFRIEIEDFSINVHDAFVLLGPQATVPQGQAKGKAGRIVDGRRPEIGNRVRILGPARNAPCRQNIEALRVGGARRRGFEQFGELRNGILGLAVLEQRQTQVEPKAGTWGSRGTRPAPCDRADRFLIVALAGFQHANLSVGFGEVQGDLSGRPATAVSASANLPCC